MAERLNTTRNRVAEGTSLAVALSSTHALTSMVAELVAVGERAGALPLVLAKAAAMEDQGAERRLKVLVSLVEPSLIVAFAAVVAFVAAALLQAVYAVRPG